MCRTIWPVPEIDVEAFPIARPVGRRHLRRERQRHYTVCQIIREIWAETDNAVTKRKCEIALRMTKTMIDEICRHEPKWGRYRWPWKAKEE